MKIKEQLMTNMELKELKKEEDNKEEVEEEWVVCLNKCSVVDKLVKEEKLKEKQKEC